MAWLAFFWAERLIGLFLGWLVLYLNELGRWDDALLKGSMKPPDTPKEQAQFMLLCFLLPELVIAAFLWAYLNHER